MNRRAPWIGVFALVALTAATYLPALRNGFIWDDDDHLTQNPAMTAPDGLRQIWSSLAVSRYYPLTLTSFWLQRRLWGLNPLPYHAINISFHAANAVLVFLLLRRLNVCAAWAAAALWAVHPVNVESVAWITELKNTQSGLFFFASLLCFLRYDEQPTRSWYTASVLCFVAALLSKPSTVILPGVLLLYIWWQRGRWQRLDFVRTSPFFALAAGMSLLTISEQGRHVQGAASNDWSLRLAERCLVAGKVLWFYAAKLLWPHNLAFIYPRWEIRTNSVAAWLPLASALVVGLALTHLRRRPWARHCLLGLGCFALALFPVLGFFNVYYFRFSFVADHFNYLASVALLALTAAGVTAFIQQRMLQAVVALVVLLIFSAFSWQRVDVFHSDETLWQDTLRKNPDAFIAHNNLGTILREKGQYVEAIAHWQDASRISPNAWQPHMNSGKLFLDTGNYQEAVVEFREALRLKPESIEPRYGLGMTYTKLGQYEKARVEFEDALRARSDEGKVHYWLGEIEEHQGHMDQAVQHYLLAIQYEPALTDAYIDLGLLRQKRGELDRAITCFQTAIRLRPDDSRARDALAAAEKLRQQSQH